MKDFFKSMFSNSEGTSHKRILGTIGFISLVVFLFTCAPDQKDMTINAIEYMTITMVFGTVIEKFVPKNLEQKYLLSALYDQSIPMLTVFGGAGSGKTYVTMVAAINMLDEKKFERIILTKSRAQATTASGGRIGDVPGTIIDKMKPVFSSYERALAKIWGKTYLKIFEQKLEEGKIECIPLEYMRGEDFTNALVICDEAQNVEIHQFKTLITRLGEKSKLILMADTDQIDEKENRKGKLCPVLQTIGLDIYQESPLTSFVELIEIERSPLAELGIQICKKLVA